MSLLSRLQSEIDRAVNFCKYPVILLAVLSVKPLLQTYVRFWEVRHQLNMTSLMYFAIGAAGIFALWIFARVRRGTLGTLEHELTHVVFAWLTLHWVRTVEVDDSGSGRMSFRGKGNWLIALAPYFFPLAAMSMLFFAVAFEHVTQQALPEWVLMSLGAAVAYNLCSFWEQLHPQQTDFVVAGWVTTFCFLPAANLFTFGLILSYAAAGGRGVFGFFRFFFYYAKQMLSA